MSETTSTADRTVRMLMNDLRRRQYEQHISGDDALRLFASEHEISTEDTKAVTAGLSNVMLAKVLLHMVDNPIEPGDTVGVELVRRQMHADVSGALVTAYIVGVLVGRGWVDQS